MPKKTIKRKKKQSKEPNYVLKHIVSLCLIAIGVFIAIHTYFDQQEGLFGLAIEAATLYGFGIFGYSILPVGFFVSGVFVPFLIVE